MNKTIGIIICGLLVILCCGVLLPFNTINTKFDKLIAAVETQNEKEITGQVEEPQIQPAPIPPISEPIKICAVEVPEMDTLICPYCHGGLTVYSSSYLASMAQMRCYHCGYYSPEVHINKPDAELECIELIKNRLLNGGWTEKDFVGD